MAPSKVQGPKRTHCSPDDYYVLLDYLEEKVNYDHLFGAGRMTHVGGKFMSKASAWDMAATELKTRGFQETKGVNLYKRWQRYISNFREAKELSLQTGEGLSEAEIKKGMTFEDKLNAKCKHFYKFDALMGSRANIQPLAKSGSMGFDDFCTPQVGDSQCTPSCIPDLEVPQIPVGGDVGEMEFSDERSCSPHWSPEDNEQNEQQSEVEEMEGKQGTVPGEVAGIQTGEENDAAEHLQQQKLKTSTSVKAARRAEKQRPKSSTDQRLAKGLKGGSEQRGAAKPCLADVYQECKLVEAETKGKYFQRKENWKLAELADRKEARADELKRRREELEFESYEKRLDREEKLDERRRERRKEIIIAALHEKKTPEEIRMLCALMD